jgi:hypothetical protein
MSDLQCPARLVVAWPRSLPDGPASAQDLALELVGALSGERLAMVYGDHAVLADTVSAGVGVRLAALPDLETVADLHRGETVLVLGRGNGILDPVRSRLVRGPAGDVVHGHAAPGQAPGWVFVRVDVDADGWVIASIADDETPL